MTVQQWLDSGREYEVGRQLYEALGDNDRLKRLFAQGANHYNREAVLWELTKLAKAGATAPVRREPGLDDYGNRIAPLHFFLPLAEAEKLQNATQTLRSTSSEADYQAEVLHTSPAEENPLLVELKVERRLLYDERDGVHAQLEPAEDEEECRLIAIRMMELCRQLDAHWHTVRYVEQHGHLPPPPAAAPGLDTLPPAELLRRRNNLRSLVSKLKTKPARASDLVQAQTDLAAVEALLSNG